MTKTFRDLDVASELCDALEANGITHPFPIQELTLPLALGGHDLIGQARTGTGKTLAFGLPLLQRVDPALKQTQALVIVPTRELCLQVYDDLSIGAALELTSISVYGGVGYDEQIDALTGGAHVVVGTPGRLLDLFNRGVLDLSKVTELVLDEADEMLDMGFLPDVERLIEGCQGEDRHTMLFSATMPTAIVKLARRYMDHPTFTRADHEVKTTADNVTQHFFQVHRMDKPRLLARILQDGNRGGVYVFVRTKHMADRLVNDLEELRIPSIAIHGDLRQSTREKNLDRFREGKATVLVCTEVAARGLDVSGVTHVVNYDCPDDEKMYLHRIGRTARAGEAGVAITFAEFNEIDRLNVIRKKVEATDAEVHQVFSTSPVLDELFTLPAEKPWEHLTNVGGGKDGPRKPSGERSGAKGGPRDGGGGSRDGAKGGSRSGPKGGSRGGAKGGGAKGGEASGGAKGGRTKGDDSTDRSRAKKDTKETATTAPEAGAGANAAVTSDDATRDTTRDAGSATGRRSPSTDGKPKSGRAREGRGGDHDSRSSARTSSGAESRSSRSGTKTPSGGDTTDTARDDSSAASSDGTRNRTRTRTRSRTRTDGDRGAAGRAAPNSSDGGSRSDSSDSSDADRSGPTEDRTDRGSGSGGSSGRTRARGGASVKDRATDSGDTGPDPARSDRGSSSDSDASSGSRERARGGRNRQSRSRSSSEGGKQGGDSDAGGGSGNPGPRGGSSASSGSSRDPSRSSGRGRDGAARGDDGGSGDSRGGQRGGGQRGGGQRGGGQRGGGQRGGGQRGGGGSGGTQDPTVRLSKRGEDARGGGEPQLTRRVKVEHLP